LSDKDVPLIQERAVGVPDEATMYRGVMIEPSDGAGCVAAEMALLGRALAPSAARQATRWRTIDDIAWLDGKQPVNSAKKRCDKMVALDTGFHALIGRASQSLASMWCPSP
jgi:23S rRNA G2445 N2-methylase RlmL